MWSSVVNGKILHAGCEMDLSSHSVKLSSCISNTLTKTPKTIPQKIFSQLPIHHNPPDLSPSVVSVGHAVMSPSLPRPRPNLEAELHRAQRAWQAWHLWHWVAPLGPVLSPVTPRLFAWPAWHLVNLGDIHLRFTWQAWHNLTSTVVLRGRRGTYGTGWRAWARICRL